jgi:GAF domain-containing protein
MQESEKREDNQLKNEIRDLLQALEGAGKANLPFSNDALLLSIVEAAARIFQAAAASIMLINEAEGVLEIKISTETSNENLVGQRIPLDKGIAGYVAMTGQPIAISNLEQDSRFNRDFAQRTGYVPDSILAMPLISGDRVLGVMEVLDKIDAPSFGMQDMELLAIFAGQAALAIEMSQQVEQLGETLVEGLRQIAQGSSIDEPSELFSVLAESPNLDQHKDLTELTLLLNEFAQLGEEERKTALKILTAFKDYGKARHRVGVGMSR